jgi:hypothetical protein
MRINAGVEVIRSVIRCFTHIPRPSLVHMVLIWGNLEICGDQGVAREIKYQLGPNKRSIIR